MRKKKNPKFWRGLVVMCGESPILIKDIDQDQDGYAYKDEVGTWWSEDSLHRLITAQAGFAKAPHIEGNPPNLYYRRSN